MEWKYLFMALLGTLGILLMGSTVMRPLRFMIKAVVYFSLGVVFLLVANVFLGMLGMHIGINPVTAFLAGVLHLPGVILLVVLNYLFV